MEESMTRFVPALLLSLPLWVAACATSNSTQMAEVPGPSSGPNAVKEVGEVQNANVSVRLQRYDGGDLFEFTVKNLSAERLVVDRDAVEMLSPTGARLLRLPGGTEAAYQVPSAGVHRVNLRFD